MDIQLHDKLLEYKQQMGMLGAGTPPASKQIESGSAPAKEEEVLDPVIINESNEMNRSN
jgi:hypothetical protein